MDSGIRKGNIPNYFTINYGETLTVMPTARHQATIVWLHDLNESGYHASELVKSLSLYNVKWICPSASLIPNAGFGGERARTWFNVGQISNLKCDDLVGLDTSAARVAQLFKDEPENVMKGVAGYGVGGAVALHIATLHALGSYPIGIRAVVGVNCWLPHRYNLAQRIKSTNGAIDRAEALPILLTHGYNDDMIPHIRGQSSEICLRTAGFGQVKFKTIHLNIDHAIVSKIMTDVSVWLTRKLELEGEQD